MKVILDTNVIIGLVRHNTYTLEAIRKAGITEGCITPGIYLEVLGGTQLPLKRTARKSLHLFTYLKHTEAVYKLAADWAMQFYFTRSSTTIDFLTAAVAVHHKIPLYTANLKDFERLPGLHVLPYKEWSPL